MRSAAVILLLCTSAHATNLGVELGALGYRSNAGSDIFGLHLLLGGRVFLRELLSRSWVLKPSLGFFRRGEGTAEAGVVQNVIEGGLALQYVINPGKRLRANVGAGARVDGILSQISALDTSDTTPMAFRFRMGPTVGLAFTIDRGVTWVTDFEFSLSFEKPVKPFAGLFSGISFSLD